ncbi:uncharacterized protein LOC129610379 [Condylostylus longicornis]|uniref:uncharacterized protein LOC129610379 n=1 Tax=Condylostylus longicornis TaxID=2530218 RepID=UPI00244DFE11|nr:uncharacterized protein LOC129610379 [Condylostylus longicornis]
MRVAHACWSCMLVMHVGYASGHSRWSCKLVMHVGHASWSCMLILHVGHECWSCIFCYVDINLIPKDEANSPIYIKNGKLHNPEKIQVGNYSIIALKWDVGDNSLLICGNGNNIVKLSKSEIKFECTSNNTLIESGTNKKFILNDKKCSTNIKVKVKDANKTCDFGNIIRIGFENENDFYEYIEVCYHYGSASTKYTKHIISGKAKQLATNSSIVIPYKRPTFSKDGLPFHARDGEPYKKANQISRFENITQNDGSSAFGTSSFLAIGHLTPVIDGIFNYLKQATMFYINAAPEWQDINAGNWKRVENIARCTALTLNDDLEVYTGIAGILELPNTENELQELYLKTIGNNPLKKKPRLNSDTIPKETQDDIIPVPKYFWKVLKYKDKAIAFITLNNPYAVQINTIDPCNDICSQYGYSTNGTNQAFHNFKTGRTNCCQVNDLVTKFPNDVPKELGLLKVNILRYQDCQ